MAETTNTEGVSALHGRNDIFGNGNDPVNKVNGKITEFLEKIYSYLKTGMGTSLALEQQQFSFAKQQGKTSVQAISEMSEAFSATERYNLDRDYGFRGDDLTRITNAIALQAGRQFKIGGETDLGSLAAANTMFSDDGKTVSEIASQFLHMGSNMEHAGDMLGKAFASAHKNGLSFERITNNIKTHLKEVNQYGFKNGVDGLRQMAIYAEQIGMDMGQALKASSKMNNLSGAVDVASKLSVLGGTFQQLGNPLALMNESLTDVESLQKRIGDMFSGMAKFDREKGMISVSAFDRMRINSAAEAMGLDVNEVFKSVETQARRELINRQIGNGLDEELKALIANTGTIDKNGRAGYVIDGNFVDVSQIAGNKQYEDKIRESAKNDSEKITDISQSLRTSNDYLHNIEDMFRNSVAGGQWRNINSSRETVKTFVSEDGIIPKALNAAASMEKSVSDILAGFTSTVSSLNITVGEWTGNVSELINNSNSISHSLGYASDFISRVYGVGRGTAVAANNANVTARTGGYILGESHENGGAVIEAEGGEYIINKQATDRYHGLLDAINSYGNVRPYGERANTYRDGGEVMQAPIEAIPQNSTPISVAHNNDFNFDVNVSNWLTDENKRFIKKEMEETAARVFNDITRMKSAQSSIMSGGYNVHLTK